MASGCETATWASLQVVEAGLALALVADLEIDRSWRSAGLQGTGSYALVADDLLVSQALGAVGPIAANPGSAPRGYRWWAIVANLAPEVGATSGELDAVRAPVEPKRLGWAPVRRGLHRPPYSWTRGVPR